MANTSKGSYPALRIIAAWYKAVGILISAILVISGAVIAKDDGLTGLVMLIALGAIIAFVVFVSVAEIIQLFLDSESNTRQAADHLKQLVELNTKPKPVKEKAPAKSLPKATPKPAARQASRTRKANTSQAESIKVLIKSLSDDGLSPESIAEELRNEGLPTLSGEATWTEPQVTAVLRQTPK